MAGLQLSSIVVPELHLQAYPNRLIRIDWIADGVRPQERSDQRLAFEIPILISVLKGSSLGTSLALEVDASAKQQRLWISVDFLPSVWIGSLWHQGRRLTVRGYQRSDRVRLRVSGNQANFVKLQDKIPKPWSQTDTTLPIPLASFQITRDGNWAAIKSQQLLACTLQSADGRPPAKLDDEFAVLIPAIELARFYACTTSLLARYLFGGGWQSLEWVDASSGKIVNGSTIIGQMAIKGLDYASAWHQARYKFSPHMRSWVDLVGQLLTYRRTDQRKGLQFGFPVDIAARPATIDCEAIPIHFGQTLKPARYLVTRIQLCDCPFPVDELQVHPLMHPGVGQNRDEGALETMSVPSGNVGNNPQSGGNTGSRLADPANPNRFSVAPGMPNAQPDTVYVADIDVRFAFLKGKKVSLCVKDTQKYKYVSRLEEPGRSSSDTLSGNEARGGQSDQAEGQITTNTSEESPPRTPTLDLFVEAIHELRARKNRGECPTVVSVSTRFAALSTQRLYRGEWVFKTREPNKRKTLVTVRHLLLAEITYTSGQRLLVGELERIHPSDKFAVLCFRINFRDEQDQSAFIDKLCKCIEERGWIPTWDSQQKTYDVDGESFPGLRLVHSSSQKTASDYATRLAAL